MNYSLYFNNFLQSTKQNNLYRVFTQLNRNSKSFPFVESTDKKQIVTWCSNDYLGLGVNKKVIDAVIKSTKKHGCGSGGTRNIGGNHESIVRLSKEVALFHKKEDSLIFTSGYVANVGAISAITKIISDIVIFSDEKNHASMIAGMRINNVKKHIFRHNDIEHLEELVKQYRKEVPKIIIFEGVYSMDGTIARVKEICQIAKKYNCLTYIDEVHSVTMYGSRGAGIVNLFNLEEEVDIIQGNFGKGFGLFGGYVSASKFIIDAIRTASSDFIFTTSLPPSICDGVLKSIEIVKSKEGQQLRHKHQEVVKKVKELLNIKSESHILPLIIGDASRAKQVSQNLYNKGIYIQSINYPTVKVGTERLRITPNPFHTDEMIEYLIKAVKEELK